MIEVIIHCIGDSLTAGHRRMDGSFTQETYQYWLHKYLYNHLNNATEASNGLILGGEKGGRSYTINIKSYGIPGATIAQIARQLEEIEIENAGDEISGIERNHFLVVMGGTNDFWLFSSRTDEEQNRECIDDVFHTISSIIEKARRKGFNRIFLCTIPPVLPADPYMEPMRENIIEENERIRKLGEKYSPYFSQCSVHIVDVFKAMADEGGEMKKGLCVEDGVHFTVEGNRVCGETIAKEIFRYL